MPCSNRKIGLKYLNKLCGCLRRYPVGKIVCRNKQGRAIHKDKFWKILRIKERVDNTDGNPHGPADKNRVYRAGFRDNGMDIFRENLKGICAFGFVRTTKSPKINSNNPEVLWKSRHLVLPYLTRHHQAMNENKCSVPPARIFIK